ncbi:MAG: methionyl-tRNA formyltransferase [Candidatus Gracilibacteria bacterium]|nr:methionyl-tRNA formyltransferase [Candidatus Gracilibacteria bacterium]
MKIAFFGTGEFSKSILEGILSYDDIDVALIVSQPDKPVGRKKEILSTPVKALALEKNIEVLQPEKLKPSPQPFPQKAGQEQISVFYKKLRDLNLDFIVVVAYGKIVPKEVLEAPKHGCINLHGSILPAYRGASPIQESIKAGDTKTGLTVMYMSEGMDEGDILSIGEVEIDITDKTPDIFNKSVDIGPSLLVKTLKGVLDGTVKAIPQDDSQATYCSKIEKQDGEINFETQTAKEIYDRFRAYYPWPGIYTYYKGKKFAIEDCVFDKTDLSGDEELKAGDVVEIEEDHKKQIGVICKLGILILKQVKLEGKKTMDILSFVNGNKEFLDYKF